MPEIHCVLAFQEVGFHISWKGGFQSEIWNHYIFFLHQQIDMNFYSTYFRFLIHLFSQETGKNILIRTFVTTHKQNYYSQSRSRWSWNWLTDVQKKLVFFTFLGSFSPIFGLFQDLFYLKTQILAHGCFSVFTSFPPSSNLNTDFHSIPEHIQSYTQPIYTLLKNSAKQWVSRFTTSKYIFLKTN